MRRPILALALLALLLPASGCKKNKRGTVSDTCIQLLDCVATVASTSSSAANTSYGSESECWNDTTSADACTAECQDQLEQYFAENPNQPACDDGLTVGSNVLFPSGAAFNFVSTVNNAQCNPEVNISLVELDLESDVTPTFTWSGTINGTVGDTGFESDYGSTCDLDGSAWTCVVDPTTVTVEDLGIGNFDFSGTFTTDGSAATATLFYDLADTSGSCNQSQTMSGTQ